MLKLLGSFSNGRLLVRRFDCAEVLAALADVIDAPAGHVFYNHKLCSVTPSML
jgi:hypothetical protein